MTVIVIAYSYRAIYCNGWLDYRITDSSYLYPLNTVEPHLVHPRPPIESRSPPANHNLSWSLLDSNYQECFWSSLSLTDMRRVAIYLLTWLELRLVWELQGMLLVDWDQDSKLTRRAIIGGTVTASCSDTSARTRSTTSPLRTSVVSFVYLSPSLSRKHFPMGQRYTCTVCHAALLSTCSWA